MALNPARPVRTSCVGLRALVFLLFAAPLSAAEPTIRSVNVRGLQVGATTTLTIDGDDFGKSPRLLLPFPTKQTLSPKSTAQRAILDVTPGAHVPPGYYQLRVVTDGGVSLPTAIGVDALPQLPFAATVETLPIALHGTVGGAAVLETTFTGKAGQKVCVEVEAQRLGSKLRPVVHLYGPTKLQLAWGWGLPWMHGDTRLHAVLPEDGTYTVSLHDLEYAAPAGGFFRLKVGDFKYVDSVFPPTVSPQRTRVHLIGETTTTVDRPRTGEAVVVIPWPAKGTWTGPRPFVKLSGRPEFVAEGLPHPVVTGVPFGLCGRLHERLNEQQFRVPVAPNTRVRFEVFAERIGSQLAPSLVIRNEMGGELARSEGSPGTLDPVLEYAVPDKVTAVTVCIHDARGGSGPPGVYRLIADVVQAAAASPDFRLTTPVQRLSIPVGGRAVVPVFAERRGFTGKIELLAKDFPAGVRLEEAAIPENADGVLLTLRRDNAVAEPKLAGLWGRGGPGLHHSVTLRSHPLERLQPWLASEIAFAPTTANARDFTIDWPGLPNNAAIVPGLKLPLPFQVTRSDSAAPIRITLLTSQAPPLTNGQPNPNAAIRPEKPIELAAKVTDGTMTIVLPPNLLATAYDLALQAELLTPDRQRVLATAFTPVRRLPVRLPAALKFASEAVDVMFDPRKPGSIEIRGEVMRLDGVTGEVALTLTGLPPGVTAAPVTVKAGETKFAMKVTLPANPPIGEFKGVKISATIAPDAKQPGIRVKLRDIELSLTLRPIPPKPPRLLPRLRLGTPG